MYAAVTGLVEAMKQIYPSDDTDDLGWEWHAFPQLVLQFGSGGVLKWGTLCGALTGCLSVLNMMGLHSKVGSELMDWYCRTEIPTGIVSQLYNDAYSMSWAHVPVPDDEVLAHTVANSPLCHVSISKWFAAAGVGYADKDSPDYPNGPHTTFLKKDRCAKLTAATARRCAELINDWVQDSYSATDWDTETYQECMDCHSYIKQGSTPPSAGDRQDSLARMDCNECHTVNLSAPHAGKQIHVERLWTEKLVGADWVESNTFSPGEDIRYCLRFNIYAPGKVFVRIKPNTTGAEGYTNTSGVWKQGYFSKSDNVNDTETWRFPETIPGDAGGQARFKAQIQVGDTSAGPMIYESPLKMVYFTVS